LQLSSLFPPPHCITTMDTLKSLISGEEKEKTMWDDINEQFSLTMQQRAIGFAICLGIGILLSFLSFIFFASPGVFALCYTLGNVTMLASTAFVVGPARQLKNMFAPTRIICTTVFIAAMIFTLVCVFKDFSFILVILSILIQIAALVYYCFSYIPYGRACLRNICSGVVAV